MPRTAADMGLEPTHSTLRTTSIISCCSVCVTTTIAKAAKLMNWNVKVEAIVKRIETIDYNIEAKTGDEARAKIRELFNTGPQSNEREDIMGLDLIDFESVSRA
jgi:hypothetical protein